VKQPARHEFRRDLVHRWYDRLLAAAGPRRWWPGDGRDEIIIGAVLTQNTAWKNAEQAIANLRAAGMLSLARLATVDPADIAPLIRPSGYFNLKAHRLQSVAACFAPEGRERFDELERLDTDELRRLLLGVWGIGPETVDCILLYALGRASFVIDAYTLRVVERHSLASAGATYESARRLFTDLVDPDPAVYNEFHALLVWAGHHFCKPKPRCAACPLSARDCFATARSWKALETARTAGVSPSGRRRAAV
jgi:endonuclease III related protein